MEIVKTQNLEKLNQNIKDDFFKVPNLKFDIDKLKTDLNITNRKLAWWRNRAIQLNKEVKSGKVS